MGGVPGGKARRRVRVGSAEALAALVLAAGACSSKVALRYPAAEQGAGPQLVTVQRLADAREKGSNELGVVRGGYGNVLKRIYTQRPVADLATRALEQALANRGLLARGDGAPIRLEGTVRKLDCNHYFRREAHTELELALVDTETGERLFAKSYRADETGSSAATGVFASMGALAEMAERTLRDAIDQALADPQFVAAASEVPGDAVPEEAAGAAPGDVAERLRALEALRDQGLVTPEEYRTKRREILEGL
jgi:hypothetical protein